ncbi:competence protein CoiA [Rossellomorea aquimaris]|uniref:competence protein CoiA n=1 Tax=Rossellomorea aquimaris TaxID=189382 RepID=UPI0007D05A4A|nr:competence protein CoiA family protein [Rossellomorea aquimaris]
MLTASLKNKKLFTTIHYTREELKEFRKKGKDQFYCPQCFASLILRIGNQNVPHFAHPAKSSCDHRHISESAHHLLSKKLLYDRLNQLFPEVYVEYFLKELRQTPDLFIKTTQKPIAVEIQCSSIPISDVKSRTIGYRQMGIIPFWVLTQPIKKSSLLHLTSFQQSLVSYSPHLHYYLLQFQPENKVFHLYTRLIPVTASTFISAYSLKIPLDEFTLPISLYPSQLKDAFIPRVWTTNRKKWIRNRLTYHNDRDKPFLREVYFEGDILLYLPLYIGIPLFPHAILFLTPPVQWQYYIWKDVLKKYRIFSSKLVIRQVRKRIDRGDIKVRSFPLIQMETDYHQLIMDYLTILEEAQVIVKRIDGNYCLSHTWNFPKNFHEFEKHEKEFFPILKHILKME